jgi:hypothetical protein
MRSALRISRWRLGFIVAAVALIALSAVGQGKSEDVVAAIEASIIPVEGTETPYEIPLSLDSLPLFVGWWYTLVPQIDADPRYHEALIGLVAPCCDDNSAFQCCCEKDGQACNIIRSGKGLAAYLITEHDSTAEEISESVLQWFRFARPDYYIAAELQAQGMNPATYGLTTKGSCYRSKCSVAISEGGCGGMEELIEPAIETTEG